MKEPSDLRQLRSFLGMVTHYRDMWPRRSHILSPLAELIGAKKFLWNEPQAKAFREMKALIAKDALLACADHNLPFHIETDASDCQLGARIFQRQPHKDAGNPVERDIAFCSRKLTGPQKNIRPLRRNCCLSWKLSRLFAPRCSVLSFMSTPSNCSALLCNSWTQPAVF